MVNASQIMAVFLGGLVLAAIGYYYWIVYTPQTVQAIEAIQKDNTKAALSASVLGSNNNLLDKALRNLTRLNDAGYSYESVQEEKMFAPWSPLSKYSSVKTRE